MFGTRFFLEFFKENNSVLTENFPLTMGQLLSLPLALIGLYLIFRKKKS
jgi:prolipoprotein diacylglyceryltransferase